MLPEAARADSRLAFPPFLLEALRRPPFCLHSHPGYGRYWVAHTQGGQAWGLCPGELETRAVASGTALSALPHQMVPFSVPKCCHFSLKFVPLSHEPGEERRWASAPLHQHVSLPQESPSSPSIAKMNGGCMASFIKYE